jgi:cell division protein FtsL
MSFVFLRLFSVQLDNLRFFGKNCVNEKFRRKFLKLISGKRERRKMLIKILILIALTSVLLIFVKQRLKILSRTNEMKHLDESISEQEAIRKEN